MAELPKNPKEYSYRGDEKITISGEDFSVLQVVVEKAIEDSKKVIFGEINEWIDLKTSKVVENPTQEQINNREVALFPSVQKTLQNRVVTYNENLPIYARAGELLYGAHMNNIEEGLATPIATLQEEAQKAQAEQAQKGTMTVVEDTENNAPQAESAEADTDDVVVKSEN